MPTPYQFALLLVRMFSIMGIVAGLFLVAGALALGVWVGTSSTAALQGVPYSLITYGLLDLFGSIGTLLFCKKIAAFSVKT